MQCNIFRKNHFRRQQSIPNTICVVEYDRQLLSRSSDVFSDGSISSLMCASVRWTKETKTAKEVNRFGQLSIVRSINTGRLRHVQRLNGRNSSECMETIKMTAQQVEYQHLAGWPLDPPRHLILDLGQDYGWLEAYICVLF